MSQRCVLSPLPWDLSHANECARMQILRPGHLCFSPHPHPHVSGGFLRQSLPHEAKGAGRNLPELTPGSTVSWGGYLRWEFCLF